MSLISIWFPVFALCLLVAYWAAPGKYRWLVLLAASLCFYCMAGVRNAIYILITALSTYGATLGMEAIGTRSRQVLKAHKEQWSREEKSAWKAKTKARRRLVMILTLVLNFGILCVFKYAHFALAQVNAVGALFGAQPIGDSLHLIIPLGISFYTFQTMGYLVDIYWEKYSAERSFLRVLLCVSFFAQITQGPISDAAKLREELFTTRPFTYENFSRGFQRLLVGFFKKLVIANLAAPYVADVFANYASYAGITVAIGAVFYSIQIYADFSGYMDIVCGLCQMLGIRLTENFNRPYFSKSVAEYWRRWHISLGAWFKTYIYYPIAVAKWNQRLGKRAQTKLGKTFGKTVCASIALVAVWLTTGLWHGASWSYIAWGGVNGLCIIAALWLEPAFTKAKHALRINEDAWLWRAFQTLRTFALVTLIKVLPEVGTLSQGLGLWKQIFTNFTIPTSASALLPFATDKTNLIVVCLGALALLVASLMQRKRPLRDYFARIPAVLRVVLLVGLTIAIVYFGGRAASGGGGFLYAQF